MIFDIPVRIRCIFDMTVICGDQNQCLSEVSSGQSLNRSRQTIEKGSQVDENSIIVHPHQMIIRIEIIPINGVKSNFFAIRFQQFFDIFP